ncbi:hypothetical protein [Stenotrophomonas sp. SY1]|uniref:hypothetical protein n=1 Tax=Stenotrophomonas sp. SY1 TaxID=477235 RepID=UPI001E620C33|nr:hypothetical protein [Stenotrophomonas sp. SY1]MCD9088285.1 hypothetical protein [Stenotrophomonas sp. SY1]
MKHLIKNGVLALAVVAGLGTAIAPAHAGDGMDLNASEASVLITGFSAVMVVSGPVFLSAAGVGKVTDMSRESQEKRQDKRRISAGPLPDMKVKAIDQTADGGRSVALEDPANAENTAQLHWPQREDNPAANFVVGQTVAFTASPKGAGWMLRAEDGAVLTFVPTIEAADESRTQTL